MGACKQKTLEQTSLKSKTTSTTTHADQNRDRKQSVKEDILEQDGLYYARQGRKDTDFLPLKTEESYAIQYQAEGDLNHDGLNDKALILHNKKQKTAARPVMILLKNSDGSYYLDQISTVAFPAEYNEFDYKLFDTEDISIRKGVLSIQLYSMGSIGNIEADFKYQDKEFLLFRFEGNYRGAGSSALMTYQFPQLQAHATYTDYIDDEAETSSKEILLSQKKYDFKTTAITEFLNE